MAKWKDKKKMKERIALRMARARAAKDMKKAVRAAHAGIQAELGVSPEILGASTHPLLPATGVRVIPFDMSKKRARAAATTLMTNLDRHGFNPNAGSRHQGKREIAGFLEQQQGSYIGVSKGQGILLREGKTVWNMFGKYGDEIRGCRRNACAAAGIEGGVLKELQARAEAASPDFPPLADTLPGYTNVSVVHRPAGNPVDGDGEGVFAHSDGGDLKGSITAAVDLVADDVRLPFSTVPGSDAVGKRAGIERVSKYGVTVKVDAPAVVFFNSHLLHLGVVTDGETCAFFAHVKRQDRSKPLIDQTDRRWPRVHEKTRWERTAAGGGQQQQPGQQDSGPLGYYHHTITYATYAWYQMKKEGLQVPTKITPRRWASANLWDAKLEPLYHVMMRRFGKEPIRLG